MELAPFDPPLVKLVELVELVEPVEFVGGFTHGCGNCTPGAGASAIIAENSRGLKPKRKILPSLLRWLILSTKGVLFPLKSVFIVVHTPACTESLGMC